MEGRNLSDGRFFYTFSGEKPFLLVPLVAYRGFSVRSYSIPLTASAAFNCTLSNLLLDVPR